MSMQPNPNPFWPSCDRHKVAIALSTVSVLTAALGFGLSPTQSAPLSVQSSNLPVLTPQMSNPLYQVPIAPLKPTPASVSTPWPNPSDPRATIPAIKAPSTQPSIQIPQRLVPESSVSKDSVPDNFLLKVNVPKGIVPEITLPKAAIPQLTPPALETPPIAAPNPTAATATEALSTPPPIAGTVPLVVSPYETDTYRLAVGDSISIFVANVPEFTTKNVIMSDGTVSLPVAGSVPLWGMTLTEAAQTVTQRYVQLDVLRKPFIAVQLLASSPLKIALSGAINRPGAYNIPVVDTKLPTITDAIALAGGIAGTADLKEVKVYRLNPRGGGDQVIEVNLWSLLQSADLAQDITLRSGDRILLAKAPVKPEEASLIGSANLSPTDMQVGILGEVLAPGIVKLPPNTSLNQALLMVGGFNKRAQKKTVELIRANPDGSVTRRRYPVRWSDPISENANPILQQRDVVLVGSSTLARYGDILGKVLSPLSQSFSFLSFFNFLFPAAK